MPAFQCIIESEALVAKSLLDYDCCSFSIVHACSPAEMDCLMDPLASLNAAIILAKSSARSSANFLDASALSTCSQIRPVKE